MMQRTDRNRMNPPTASSIGNYTFLIFFVFNLISLPVIYFYYPETKGRSLPEIDVVFAHAHLSKRRPTIVADEMPQLNDHQVDVLQERYNIHGESNADTIAADDNMDLSIPPPQPESPSACGYSGNSTRVPSFSEMNAQVAEGSKSIV